MAPVLQAISGRFPKVRTGRPDYGRTRHFDNEIGFFLEFFFFFFNENSFLSCILFKI